MRMSVYETPRGPRRGGSLRRDSFRNCLNLSKAVDSRPGDQRGMKTQRRVTIMRTQIVGLTVSLTREANR